MKNIFILVPGARIEAFRIKKGLTKITFASELGVSRQTVNNWEKAKINKIDEDLVPKIAKVLGVDVKLLTEADKEVTTQSKDDYVPAHVLEHYRNPAEHIMNENKELWSWVKELRAKGSNAK